MGEAEEREAMIVSVDGIQTIRSRLPWTYDDGGRKAAGFKGSADDCACRAIAIATETPYEDVYQSLNLAGQGDRLSRRRSKRSSAREGIYKTTMRRFMDNLGWEWVPTMQIGQGCKVHLAQGELPPGRLIVNLSRHFAAVVDGVVYDTYDPTRDGSRCVYGYWAKRKDGGKRDES